VRRQFGPLALTSASASGRILVGMVARAMGGASHLKASPLMRLDSPTGRRLVVDVDRMAARPSTKVLLSASATIWAYWPRMVEVCRAPTRDQIWLISPRD